MSDQDAPREIDPQTGYPRLEESSPPQGAPTEGATPGSTEAAPAGPQTQHEPPPNSPRFNEVYRNWKETERQLEALRERYEGLNRALEPEEMPRQMPTQAPDPESDNPFEPIISGIEQRVQKIVAPIVQKFEQQERTLTIQKQISNLKSAHPEYDPRRDDELIAANIKRYGVRDLDAAYRLTFPERVVGNAPVPSTQRAPAPVADVPRATSNAPQNSPEALMQEFNDPRTNRNRREEIASILADAGGWGARRAEKALGLG